MIPKFTNLELELLHKVTTWTYKPTVSANGAFIADLGAGSGGGQIVSEVLQIIDPGNSLLITVTESSATVPVSVEIVWYEIPYTTNIAI